jgi:hypothetical protein
MGNWDRDDIGQRQSASVKRRPPGTALVSIGIDKRTFLQGCSGDLAIRPLLPATPEDS